MTPSPNTDKGFCLERENQSLLQFNLPAAVCPLKHCNLPPEFQSHMPIVLSNDAVRTLFSSKQMYAQVCVFRTNSH